MTWRCIELFPCSGGMAEGFRRVGITFDFAFDWDSDARESYASNLGHRPIGMDVRDLVRMVRGGWSPGPIDLLVADPPCTPWSRAGKRRGIEDKRDMLKDTCELIRLLKPRAYLIGNVPGLQDATQWHHVQEHIGGLVRHGYCVADYIQLDAADFGVPQHRIRPFWFGHLDGPCISWPERTHGSPEECSHPALPGMRRLLPWVTCREALSHLPLEELGRRVRMKIRATGEDGRRNGGDRTRCSTPDEPARTVVAKADRKGGQILLNDRHPPCRPDAPAPTLGAKYRGQTEVLAAEHPRHPLSHPGEPSRTIRTNGGRASGAASMLWLDDPRQSEAQALLEWPWDRPATTVCVDRRLAPAGYHEKSFLSDNRGHGPNAIVLSEKVAALLQGFPDGWVFAGKTKKARWSQIGQAMPPPLAEAVARFVVQQMERALLNATGTEGA